MPQVNEYLPQVESSEPQGGISPNLDLVGAAGRGLERAGAAISEGADVIHRKEAQKEVSDVYAQMAQKRAQWSQQLQKEVSNPDFSTEDFQARYADDVNKMGQALNTGDGKDYFNRQASRLGGALLTTASKVQTQVSYNQFRSANQTAINGNVSALMADPSQAPDIIDGVEEYVDKQGSINPKIALSSPQIKEYMKREYAKAAIMGWTNLDPGSKENDTDGAGRKWLDSGAFDQYLRPEDKKALDTYVDRHAHAADVNVLQGNKAVENARKADYEVWGQSAIQKLDKGALTIKDLDAAQGSDGQPLLKWEDHERWTKMIADQAKDKLKTNNVFKSGVIDGIQNGEYNSSGDIDKLVGPGRLAPKDAMELKRWMNQTDDIKQQTTGVKHLIDESKAALKADVPGAEGLMAERRNLFFSDMQDAIKANKAAGKNPNQTILNPANPDYLGKQLNTPKYRPSMQDQMAEVIKHQVGDATAGKDPKARKEGESPADWQKRVNGR